MEYVRLGNTGLEVSKICLGCMGFGDVNKGWFHKWVLDEEHSEEIIKHALELGINFFDTANQYSYGSSESYLGSALKKHANRDQIVIATKFNGGPMHDGPNGKGLSRKTIFQEIEHSLKRLQTDYIDILYVHRWDNDTPIEETMEALHDLVKLGKVRYLGASTMYAWQFAKAQHIAKMRGWTPFTVMQNHYNLIYREEEREMIPMCKDMGVGLVPYSPLAAGRLAREWEADSARSKSDDFAKGKYSAMEAVDRQISKRVGELAEKYQCTMAQISLAWLFAKGVASPVVGPTKAKYLDDYLGALELKLESEDIEYLEALYVPHKVYGPR